MNDKFLTWNSSTCATQSSVKVWNNQPYKFYDIMNEELATQKSVNLCCSLK